MREFRNCFFLNCEVLLRGLEYWSGGVHGGCISLDRSFEWCPLTLNAQAGGGARNIFMSVNRLPPILPVALR